MAKREKHYFYRYVFCLLTCVVFVIMSNVSLIFASTIGPPFTAWDFKQKYYYGNVVAYKDNSTGVYATAFSNSLNDWNYKLDCFKWGKVSSIPSGRSNNTLSEYYLVNANEQGRNLLAHSGGYYVYAHAGLNTYNLNNVSPQWRRSVAGHELGHSMSLGDYNKLTSVLMSWYRERDTLYTPQDADVSGVRSVYE